MSWKTLIVALCLCATSHMAHAGDPTAFDLIKEGNRYVGEQSKDKVVMIHSDKSTVTLAPTIWYIGYYDPDAPFKVAEVKFASGQELNVDRPMRPFEPMNGGGKVLEHARLKVDSERALKIATDQPALNHLTLRASQMWLQHGDDGPVWKVKLWAAKIRKTDEDADIGDTIISAEDGSIVKSSLRPDKVD